MSSSLQSLIASQHGWHKRVGVHVKANQSQTRVPVKVCHGLTLILQMSMQLLQPGFSTLLFQLAAPTTCATMGSQTLPWSKVHPGVGFPLMLVGNQCNPTSPGEVAADLYCCTAASREGISNITPAASSLGVGLSSARPCFALSICSQALHLVQTFAGPSLPVHLCMTASLLSERSNCFAKPACLWHASLPWDLMPHRLHQLRALLRQCGMQVEEVGTWRC